jgi:thiol-disulfide isomerase/thioredoxin
VEPLTARPRLLLAAVLGAAALAATGCGGDDDVALPDVELPALEGFAQEASSLDVASLEGPAVLNVWATWCEPCKTELPQLQRASDDHPGVRFVGIDESVQLAESAGYLADVGVTYEQFVDTDGAFADAAEIVELPVTIVVGADGDVIRHDRQITYEELVDLLAET